jgi:hypothetical protein
LEIPRVEADPVKHPFIETVGNSPIDTGGFFPDRLLSMIDTGGFFPDQLLGLK